jgi:hypothetical protein
LSGAADNPELRAALDSVLDEVEHLELLAHNLLVLARTRSAPPSSNGTPADLASFRAPVHSNRSPAPEVAMPR